MERRIRQKTLIILLTAVFFAFTQIESVFAQVPSQLDQLRIQIWADMDAFPGSFMEDSPSEEEGYWDVHVEGDENHVFNFAIARAKKITPFLLSGMLSGWTFEYTPSDKARRVQEYFEFEEIQPFDRSVNSISYHNPMVDEAKLMVWAYCDRTDTQKIVYERWNTITHPKVKGIGEASVEKGFDGIKEACGNAVKNGVREYWRTYEKNKPKEISGSILVVGNPRIYIKEGKYIVDLDFFMETDRIIRYSVY